MSKWSKWSKCPPWVLNCEMLKRLGTTGELLNYPHWADKASAGVYYKDSDSYEWYDYCTNMALLWPVMLKYNISIDRYYNGSYTRVWGYCDIGLVEMQCVKEDLTRTIVALCLTMQDCWFY